MHNVVIQVIKKYNVIEYKFLIDSKLIDIINKYPVFWRTIF